MGLLETLCPASSLLMEVVSEPDLPGSNEEKEASKKSAEFVLGVAKKICQMSDDLLLLEQELESDPTGGQRLAPAVEAVELGLQCEQEPRAGLDQRVEVWVQVICHGAKALKD
eukprot:503949-Lingulodinium_polyedra.AAC.1